MDDLSISVSYHTTELLFAKATRNKGFHCIDALMKLAEVARENGLHLIRPTFEYRVQHVFGPRWPIALAESPADILDIWTMRATDLEPELWPNLLWWQYQGWRQVTIPRDNTTAVLRYA